MPTIVPKDDKYTLALAREVDTLETSISTKATTGGMAAADAAVLASAVQRANHTGTQSADTLTDGTTNKAFLATERTKLSGVATSATANSSDATLLARGNQTGTQLAATVSDFNAAALLAAPAETTSTLGATINGASAAVPNDTDIVATAASSVIKKITWTNVKAFLKTYFDTLYQAVGSYQPLDSDLTTIAGLTATTDSFIQSKASAWASRTIAQVKVDLGLTGTNSGDQTTIVGISGTTAQFNTALSDADFATGGGTATGTNTGDNAANTLYSGLAASKQDTLVSGTTIKTINGSSVLGSGDLVVAASASDTNRNLYISTADVNLTANYSIYYPSEYEVGSGFVYDLASAAIMEIG